MQKPINPQWALLFLFSSCTILFLWGCSHRDTRPAWQSGVIESAGTYISTPDSLRIEVSDAKGLVRFAVYDRLGRHLFTSDRHASVYQRWTLYLDSNQRIWDASSDIGGVVWEPDSTGQYHSKEINATLGKRMVIPTEVAFALRYSEL